VNSQGSETDLGRRLELRSRRTAAAHARAAPPDRHFDRIVLRAGVAFSGEPAVGASPASSLTSSSCRSALAAAVPGHVIQDRAELSGDGINQQTRRPALERLNICTAPNRSPPAIVPGPRSAAGRRDRRAAPWNVCPSINRSRTAADGVGGAAPELSAGTGAALRSASHHGLRAQRTNRRQRRGR
jgi:hypothetical protein